MGVSVYEKRDYVNVEWFLAAKKQSQFRYLASSGNWLQDFVSTNQKLFHGFGCRKGYTALYVKLEFYEFWEVNHENQ